MSQILLVSMPYGALNRQALGLSLLKAGLAKAHVACDMKYLTFTFAEFIGTDDYCWITSEVPYTAFAGEWTFASSLYDETPNIDEPYINAILVDKFHLDQTAIRRILRIRSRVSAFLDYCLAAMPWGTYRIVGFTSTFEQNLASLTLAKRLKKAYPHLNIVFGGANWEGPMGLELHRYFPFVDYVCSGEADDSFPRLVSYLLSPTSSDKKAVDIPGLVFRVDNLTVSTGPAELVSHMDQLPVPDFSDYFRDLSESTVAASITPTILMETSRGCWWGAKSHCTFCGLNGGSMAFRGKSASRALSELQMLCNRWQIDFVEMVDNIMDLRWFAEFLPALVREGSPYKIFYEIKANLSRRQLALLAQAGVYRIQPGIESMSDHVLQLMRKGITGLRNIQLLKWSREYGIAVDWNLLYGFPGETWDDYESMLKLFPSIRFLSPPTACGPLRLDRFSPYFNAPASFGLAHVKPLPAYRFLYPFSEEALGNIAYFFEYGYANDREPEKYATGVIRYAMDWLHNPERGTLSSVERLDGQLILLDTRSDAMQREYTFSGLERAVYEYCDELRSGATIIQHLQSSYPDASFTDEQVIEFLETLVRLRLMVTDGRHYLSLAITSRPAYNLHMEVSSPEKVTTSSSQGEVVRSAAKELRVIYS
jgi:ribosomal peptide maturation radical SAM protein 1